MANYKSKKRVSPVNLNKKIDYKDINLLKNFITEYGKILSRRTTNLTVKQQKELKISIKRARILSLLPFVLKNKN
jgi:small subunit ribosomal protein S18